MARKRADKPNRRSGNGTNPRPRPAAPKASGQGGSEQRGRQGYSVGEGGRARRSGATAAGSGGRGRGRLWLVLATVALAAVAAVAAFLVLRGDDESYAAAIDAGTCREVTAPNTGAADHLAEGEPAPKYPNDPPLAGKHDPAPALWGVYDTEVPQTTLVHNLEHGGLVIQYGRDVPRETVRRLEDDVRDDRDFTIVAPYPKLGASIAYTMWTRGVTCSAYEPAVLEEMQGRRNQPPAPEVPQDPARQQFRP